jgi:hypothetical protein
MRIASPADKFHASSFSEPLGMVMQGSLKFRKGLFQLKTAGRESLGAQYADAIFQTPEHKSISEIL